MTGTSTQLTPSSANATVDRNANTSKRNASCGAKVGGRGQSMKATSMVMGEALLKQYQQQATANDNWVMGARGAWVDTSQISDEDMMVQIRKLLHKDIVGHGHWTKKKLEEIGFGDNEVPTPVKRDVKLAMFSQKNQTRVAAQVRMGTTSGVTTPYTAWANLLKNPRRMHSRNLL